jgi:hypothetical protein
MDQEGLNFLDFLVARIHSLRSGGEGTSNISSAENGITFSTLLHPQKTSRAVVTQGFMYVLALATKGFLSVRQNEYENQSSEDHGVRYEYGEIFLYLGEM